MKASEYGIVTTTTDSKENAEAITQSLLEKRLVACVQSFTIQSTYHWEGKITDSEEILLQMKTKRTLFEKIQTVIAQLHAYDVPEILMVPLTEANSPYLQWLDGETIET